MENWGDLKGIVLNLHHSLPSRSTTTLLKTHFTQMLVSFGLFCGAAHEEGAAIFSRTHTHTHTPFMSVPRSERVFKTDATVTKAERP